MANDSFGTNSNPETGAAPHPDYLDAQKRSKSAIYPPYAFYNWMTGAPYPDDLAPLNDGLRLSPKAARSTLAAYCAGVVTREQGLIPPHSRQAAIAAAAYGYFTDLVSKEEMYRMFQGKAIQGNHSTEPEDVLLDEHPLFHSKMYSTLESAALEPRWLWPGTTKVFFHGTWNGFPHPGQILYLSDTLDAINLKYNVHYERMCVLIACDQNQEIEFFGEKSAAMDTLMRMSFMSYLPYVDMVAPSGSWGPNGDVDKHWRYKLNLLRPNFICYETSDPRFPEMAARARDAGAIVIPNIREGTGSETFVFDPDRRNVLDPLPGNAMSSRNLREGTVGDREKGIDYQFTHLVSRLLTKKYIREQMYGIKNWFANYPE